MRGIASFLIINTYTKMKIILLLSAFIALTNSCSVKEKATTPPVTTQWKLVWADEFNRDDIFATGIWSKISRKPNVDWRDTMSDDESLFEIKDGNLILLGKMNTDLQKDPSPYITGGVYTIDKKYFEPGKLEIRCKLEATKGSWPAIWMLPKTAKWPTGGEIDILERLNFDSFVYQTVHSTYTKKGIKGHQNSITAPILSNEFNVYSVEIDANELRFFVNNQLTFIYPKIVGEEEQFPFNRAYYLLIDMQLGGEWVGKVTPFNQPVKMYIDWVRFYQKK